MCFGSDAAEESSKRAEKQAKRAAEEAKKKEAERQARLNAAMAKISGAFEGTPATRAKTNKFDWSKVDPGKMKSGGAVSGLPSGFTFVQTPGKPGTPGRPGRAAVAAGRPPTAAPAVAAPPARGPGNPYAPGSGAAKRWDVAHGYAAAPKPQRTGYTGGRDHSPSNPQPTYVSNTRDHWRQDDEPMQVMQQSVSRDHGGGSENQRAQAAQAAVPGTAGTPATWQIRGPDGKMYDANDPILYTTGKNTAGTAGFDKAFYDKYKNAMLANYEPQVAEQYGDATDETTFRLARAGTLESSAATDAMADLAGQNVKNVADVRSQADKAVGDLKKTIAQEKDNAILQAQAVEDPSIASNNALAKVANLQQTQAPTSILGDVFKVATIGGANALGGYQSAMTSKKVADAINAARVIS